MAEVAAHQATLRSAASAAARQVSSSAVVVNTSQQSAARANTSQVCTALTLSQPSPVALPQHSPAPIGLFTGMVDDNDVEPSDSVIEGWPEWNVDSMHTVTIHTRNFYALDLNIKVQAPREALTRAVITRLVRFVSGANDLERTVMTNACDNRLKGGLHVEALLKFVDLLRNKKNIMVLASLWIVLYLLYICDDKHRSVYDAHAAVLLHAHFSKNQHGKRYESAALKLCGLLLHHPDTVYRFFQCGEVSFALFYHCNQAILWLKDGSPPGANIAAAVNAAIVSENRGQPFTREVLVQLALPALLPPGPEQNAVVEEDDHDDASAGFKAVSDMTPIEFREHTRKLLEYRKTIQEDQEYARKRRAERHERQREEKVREHEMIPDWCDVGDPGPAEQFVAGPDDADEEDGKLGSSGLTSQDTAGPIAVRRARRGKHDVHRLGVADEDEVKEAEENNFEGAPTLVREEKFEVLDIVSVRINYVTMELEYLVRWVGYPDSDASWEPWSSVGRFPAAHDYWLQHMQAFDGEMNALAAENQQLADQVERLTQLLGNEEQQRKRRMKAVPYSGTRFSLTAPAARSLG